MKQTLLGTSPIRMKQKLSKVATALLFTSCFALSPIAQAVVPAPDGGYPGGNTAEGQNALLNLTGGTFNTAVGFFSLRSNTDGQFNTGVGAGALLANAGTSNTATGAGALLSNAAGFGNTANGAFALFNNTDGPSNTATGLFALFANTTGANNVAVGNSALEDNTTGTFNSALGFTALTNNTEGGANTAIGFNALANNTGGSNNVAVGSSAGFNQTTGSNNIYIGDVGAATESNVIKIGADPSSGTPYEGCYIGGVVGIGPFASTVTIDPVTGQLGELVSSKRFKKDIDPMGNASKAIFSLKPVTFHYKKDKTNTPQFGLIAEEVAKVNPALIGVDNEGKPHTVRYEQINAMLLNEFLKEHKKVEEQEAKIAQLTQEMATVVAHAKEQDSKIQKVSAQVEMDKAATKVVLNNP